MWWVRVALLSILLLVAVKGDSGTIENEENAIKAVSRPDVNLDVKADVTSVSPQDAITSDDTDKVKLCCRRRRVRRCCRCRRRRCCRRRGHRCIRRRYRCRRRRYRCRRRRYRCRRRRYRCRRRRYRCRGRRFRCRKRRYRCRRRRVRNRMRVTIKQVPTSTYYRFIKSTLYYNIRRGRDFRKYRVRYRWRRGRLFAYVQRRWRFVRKYGQYGTKYRFSGSQYVATGHWRSSLYFFWKGRVLYLGIRRSGRQRFVKEEYRVRYRWRGRTLYYFDSGRWSVVRKYTINGISYVFSGGRFITKSRCSRVFYFKNRRLYVRIRYGGRVTSYVVSFRYSGRRLMYWWGGRWYTVRRYRRNGRWYIIYRGQYIIRRPRPIICPIKRVPTSTYYTFDKNTLYYNIRRGRDFRKYRVRCRWRRGRLFAYVQRRWQLVRKYGQYGAKYTFNGRRFVISGHWRPRFYFSWKGTSLYLMFRCGRQYGKYRVRYRWRGHTLYYFDSGRWSVVRKYTINGISYVFSGGRFITKSRCSRVFYFKNRRLYVRIRYGGRVTSYVVSFRYSGRRLMYWWGGRWYTVSKYSRNGVIYCYSNGHYSQSSSSSSSSSSSTTHIYTTYTKYSKPQVTTTTTTRREYVSG